MTDVGTGLMVVGTSVMAKDFMLKLLGPTADYIGQEIAGFTQKKVENLKKIFSSAEAKLGDRINKKESVPPRILRRIYEEGSFVDTQLGAEYFGGCLASSRGSISRDDRTLSVLRLIENMSNYEIRMHYLFYILLRQEFLGTNISITDGSQARKMTMFIPMKTYKEGMDFVKEESLEIILSHCLSGLASLDLLTGYCSGSKEFLHTRYPTCSQIDSEGIIALPTSLGVQVFLHTQGLGYISENDFFSPEVTIDLLENFTIPIGAKRVIED